MWSIYDDVRAYKLVERAARNDPACTRLLQLVCHAWRDAWILHRAYQYVRCYDNDYADRESLKHWRWLSGNAILTERYGTTVDGGNMDHYVSDILDAVALVFTRAGFVVRPSDEVRLRTRLVIPWHMFMSTWPNLPPGVAAFVEVLKMTANCRSAQAIFDRWYDVVYPDDAYPRSV
jgi:hypothetical protein